MGVEGHSIVSCLKNSVADCETLAAPQMHPVLESLDDHVVDNQILKGADMNGKLSLAEVQTAEMFDSQILDVEECQLPAQSVDVLECVKIDSIHDDLEPINRDVFIIGFGQGTFV